MKKIDVKLERYFHKLSLSVFFCTIGVMFVTSQDINKIEGTIIDEFSESVSDATIFVMDIDSNYVSVCTSDSTGYFSLNYQSGIEGSLNITHILYEVYSTPLHTIQNNSIKVILNKNILEIDEVVVQAKRPTFNISNGNIVAKVSSLPGISNMPSGKLLERLPGVTRTARGSYSLNGTNAVIYINGIRQNLTPEALSSYLETLPSTAISNVELLQNPPASYDSNVQAAINIIIDTKKENGSIMNIGIFTGEQKGYLGDTGMELFYMAKSDNILFNTTFNYSNVNLYKSGFDSTVYEQMQPIVNNYNNSGRDNQASLNTNLTINLKSDNSLDFNAFAYLGISDYNYKNSIITYALPTPQKYQTGTEGYDDLYTFTAKYSSNTKKPFSFTSYYSGLYGGIRTNNDYNIISDHLERYMSSKLEMEGQMHTIASDFNSKMSIGSIEYGMKMNYNIINDKANYIRETVPVPNVDNSRFEGQEFIPAIYMGTRFSINEKISAYMALRGEYTNYHLNLKSNDSKVTGDYFNLFPAFQLTYRANIYSATLSYNSFIQRQNYMDLLPGERYVNENYSSIGNPELKPTKLNLLSLHNRFFGGRLSFLIQYQNVKDYYDKVLIYKSFKTVESPLNYTDRNNLALQLSAPVILFNNRLYGNFSTTAILQNYNNLHPDFIMPTNRSKTYKNLSAMINFQYEITNSITIDYLCNYRPKYKTIINEKHNMWRMNFGINYSFSKDKKFVVSADIENIFDSYDTKSDNYFGNNYMYSVINGNGPIFSFSLKYKFNKGKNIKDEYKDSRPDMTRIQK